MTTGRINQVTILRVRSHTLQERSRLVTPHPRRDDQDSCKVGGRAEAQRPARATPGAEAAERSPRAIQLPPLSSPRDGPGQTWGFATLNAGPHCTMRPSVGGYQPPITWVPRRAMKRLAGSPRVSASVDPRMSWDNDSQRPTIHRLLRSPQSKICGSSGHPRPAIRPRHTAAKRKCPGETAVGWGDSPPRPEPTAASEEARAVQITRPTVGGLTAMGRNDPAHGSI